MVGSHVVDLLLQQGNEVIAIDNFLTGDKRNIEHLAGHPLFEIVEANVVNLDWIDGPIDAILHLASPSSPRHFDAIPIEILRVGGAAILRMLDLAVEKEARFLFASSSEVYGDPYVHPQHEGYTGNVHLRGVRA